MRPHSAGHRPAACLPSSSAGIWQRFRKRYCAVLTGGRCCGARAVQDQRKPQTGGRGRQRHCGTAPIAAHGRCNACLAPSSARRTPVMRARARSRVRPCTHEDAAHRLHAVTFTEAEQGRLADWIASRPTWLTPTVVAARLFGPLRSRQPSGGCRSAGGVDPDAWEETMSADIYSPALPTAWTEHDRADRRPGCASRHEPRLDGRNGWPGAPRVRNRRP